MTRSVLVYGLGVSGSCAVRHLLAEGAEVTAADDDPGERPVAAAATLGVQLVRAPGGEDLDALVARVDEVVVSPGIPATHRIFALGRVPVISEVELASRRSQVPIVAVTGTNGKTTVTTLITAMLQRSGIRSVAGGNIGVPLLDAVSQQPEVVVTEVSSFQLALTRTFRPKVGAWLNFSPDHLDWHPNLEHYRESKARIWANSAEGDVVVANADDPVVLEEALRATNAGAQLVCFATGSRHECDFAATGESLVGPGRVLVANKRDLKRSFPHDVANFLGACAVAVSAGADLESCATVMAEFGGLPHRLELVGEAGGVRFYDDSKATTPASVVAAISGFDAAVLIAGGRNKGLDLSVLRELSGRLRGVVAIGEAAPEVEKAFAGTCEIAEATSMSEAVDAAYRMAHPGDVVVLSPACASFDWYGSYVERGRDFAGCVERLVAGAGAEAGR